MKKIVILMTIVTILITSFFAYKFYTNVSNSSLNASNNDQSIAEKEILLSLKLPTINPYKPYLDDPLILHSSIKTNKDFEEMTASSVSIIDTNFSMVIAGVPEGSSLNGNISSNNASISNNLNKKITRVEGSDSESSLFSFKNLNLNDYKYKFFYTDNYTEGCNGQFGANSYCGSYYIRIESIPTYPQFSIYCGVNDLSNVKYCDEFVSNLKAE